MTSSSKLWLAHKLRALFCFLAKGPMVHINILVLLSHVHVQMQQIAVAQ